MDYHVTITLSNMSPKFDEVSKFMKLCIEGEWMHTLYVIEDWAGGQKYVKFKYILLSIPEQWVVYRDFAKIIEEKGYSNDVILLLEKI